MDSVNTTSFFGLFHLTAVMDIFLAKYAYTMKITEKSDVYSFGVVLLELITGKWPNDVTFGANIHIVKWVTEATLSSAEEEENEAGGCRGLSRIVDPMMNPSGSDYEEIEKVLNVALPCTSSLPINRPSMRKFVELLVKDPKYSRPKCGGGVCAWLHWTLFTEKKKRGSYIGHFGGANI